MSYNISLVSPTKDHYAIDDWSSDVHCSWNYSNMLSALPCGYERDWQGVQAKDLLNKINFSIAELKYHSAKYRKYEVAPEKGLGTVENCEDILQQCYVLFKRHPEGIVRID